MSKSLVGTNLEWIRDWGRSQMYADIVRHARSPKKLLDPWGQNVPVDSNGWPTQDFFVVVKTDTPNLSGTYTISFNGKANLRSEGDQATFSGQSYDAATNKTTLKMTVGSDSPLTDIWLYFSGTNGGIQNLKIIRPGHTDSDLFNKQFLKSLEPFGIIRFMDFLETNNNVSSAWADRTTFDEPFKGHEERPESYEAMIELCNQAQKDLWLNIPCLADDDHILKLFQMIANKLDPDLVVYVEIGNELWNSQFKATQAHWAKAQSESGQYGYKNHYFDRTARRLVDAVKIARTVLDKARVRGIVGAQSANNYVAKRQLEYVNEKYGRPSDFLYGIAIAPYLNLPESLQTNPTASANQIAASFASRVDRGNSYALGHDDIAEANGLLLMAYEGGLDIGFKGVNTLNMINSQFLPSMESTVENYLNAWFSNRKRGSFVYFNLCCKYTKNGIWGATDNIYDLETYKMKGLVRVANNKHWNDVIQPTPTPTPTPTPPPITLPIPTGVKVIKDGDRLKIIWNPVVGTGFTYKVYRNDVYIGPSNDTTHFYANTSPSKFAVSSVKNNVESRKSDPYNYPPVMTPEISRVVVGYNNNTQKTFDDKPIRQVQISYKDGTTDTVT